MSERKYLRDGRAPIPNKESVSRVMSANKGKDTSPEIALRRELFACGIRGYRLRVAAVPGRPDVVFVKRKLAIFVHGCFWHKCPTCRNPLPKTHRDFWRKKFTTNKIRDAKKTEALERQGWRVLVFWECQLKDDVSSAVSKIHRALS